MKQNYLFKCLFMLVAALFCSAYGFAADKLEVTGVVYGPNGVAIADVTVIDKATGEEVSTNKRGKYSIKVDNDAVLIFSMLGVEFAEVEVDGQKDIDVVYGEMDEAVSVGYGSVKQTDITGAVSSIKTEGMDDASSNIGEAMIGKSAGVNVQSESSSSPEITTQVSLRGMVSLSSSTPPLVIVDGYPMEDGLDVVNSADVASIEVLKDAGSAAIYGSRAAGGVVIVTTKSGAAANEAAAAAAAEARAKAKAEAAAAKAEKAEAKAAAKAEKAAAKAAK